MRYKHFVYCFLGVMFFSYCALYGKSWKASWIGDSEESMPNSWYCFRKEIELDNQPEEAFFKIACDSKYWLWINGRMVIFEGQLKRGPTPAGTYYDREDLSSYLKKGHNTIAVLVWYWGKPGFSHNCSGRAGLVLEALIDGTSVLSDLAWKVKKHPAYGSTGEPHPNFRLPEHNIQFDARKDIGQWYQTGYDDSAWSSAIEFGRPPMEPWGALEKRPIRQWTNSGLIDYVDVTVVVNEDDTKTLICQLPYNAQVTPYLKVKASEGKTIDIRTDNYLGGGHPNVRSVYITKAGIQEYESLGWMNGHDVRYTMPNTVQVFEVKYRETGYDADFVGRFTSDDERLNTLWQKCVRTLYINMRDTYMDCPDRERAQWWGDVVNQLGQAFYLFDVEKGPLLAKKGIYELARWQRPDKVLYSPVPAGVSPFRAGSIEMAAGQWDRDGTWNWELPAQMLASVGWYGFWTYYWYSGDRQTIMDVYPHVRDYLSLWQYDSDGLVMHRPGDWDWMDWGRNADEAVLGNAWMYLALKAAIEMAQLTGNDADIAGYQRQMNSIKASFNTVFWRGDKYHAPRHEGDTDDRANAMAVVAGLAKPEFYPAIQRVLQTQYYASPYMEKYVLEALFMMGAAEQGLERMKTRFASMIDAPITTLYENFGGGRDRAGHGSYNHGWSGGALTVLSQYAAGVAPTKPAFKEFSVLPQMGHLKQIATVVPTIYGNIALTLKDDDSFSMTIDVPKDTRAIIGIPVDKARDQVISINEKVVYQHGTSKQRAENVVFSGKDEHWIRFTVPAGHWGFESK